MIYYRKIVEPTSTLTKELLWHVEAYAPSEVYPVGIAYVTEDAEGAFLRNVFVIDQFRGKGHAKRLLQSINERWPGRLAWMRPQHIRGQRLLEACGYLGHHDECDE